MNDARLFLFVFNVTNSDLVPNDIPERIKSEPTRKYPTTGEIIFQEENISLDRITGSYITSNYKLVDMAIGKNVEKNHSNSQY